MRRHRSRRLSSSTSSCPAVASDVSQKTHKCLSDSIYFYRVASLPSLPRVTAAAVNRSVPSHELRDSLSKKKHGGGGEETKAKDPILVITPSLPSPPAPPPNPTHLPPTPQRLQTLMLCQGSLNINFSRGRSAFLRSRPGAACSQTTH